jgi:hypothetical protein
VGALQLTTSFKGRVYSKDDQLQDLLPSRRSLVETLVNIGTLCGTCICKKASSGDARKILWGVAIDKRWRLSQGPLRTRSFAFVVRDEQLSHVKPYFLRLHISLLTLLEASVRSLKSCQHQKNSYIAPLHFTLRKTETASICQLRTVERRPSPRRERENTSHMSR